MSEKRYLITLRIIKCIIKRIALSLINVNQILISDKFKHSDTAVLNILLATKMIISLDLYALFYLKQVDT